MSPISGEGVSNRWGKDNVSLGGVLPLRNTSMDSMSLLFPNKNFLVHGVSESGDDKCHTRWLQVSLFFFFLQLEVEYSTPQSMSHQK